MIILKSFFDKGFDRAASAVFIAVGVIFPFAVIFSHRAIVPLILILGLTIALGHDLFRRGAAYFFDRRNWRQPFVRATLFFAGFCIWIAVTGFWGPGGDALKLAMGVLAPPLAGGAVVWLLLGKHAPTIIARGKWVLAPGVLTVLFLLGEAATGGAIRNFAPFTDSSPDRIRDMIALGRGATIATMICLPLAALLYQETKRWAAALCVIAALLAAALVFPINANVIALAVAATLFIAALKRPDAILIAICALFLAALMTAPLAALIPADYVAQELSAALPGSWAHRLIIWQNAATNALECLPIGCGADFARAIHERGEQFTMAASPIAVSLLPTHPHNLFLQIWLELGAPGVILFAAAWWFAFKALIAAPLSHLEKAAIAGAAGAFLVSALVEFSFWQVWRVSAPCYAAILVAILYRRRTGF